MKHLASMGVVFVLLLAACGTGDPSDPGSTGASDRNSPAARQSVPQPEEELGEADLAACPQGPKTDTTVKLRMVDYVFWPDTVKVPAGQMVTVLLSNTGTEEHRFSSVDLGCETELLSRGEKTTFTFEMPDQPLPFYCRPHWYAMKGEMVPR